MKRVIRQSAFETNSSSQHTIVVTKDDYMLTLDDIRTSWSNGEDDRELFYIDDKGVWDIMSPDDLSFQRYPFQILTTIEDKARYAIANYCGEYTGHTDEEKMKFIDELIAILNEVAPGLWKIDFPMQDRNVYKDMNGNEISRYKYVYRNREAENGEERKYAYKDNEGIEHEAFYDYTEEWPNIPGVDHESADLLDVFLKKESITLREFLLNKKYMILCSGDEYDDTPKLMHSPIWNKDNVVEVFDAYDAYKYEKGEYDESEDDE